jgi:uncharacterized protein HemX
VDELTAVRESIDAVRESLDHAVEELSKETTRNRVTTLLLGVLLCAVAGLGALGWWNDRRDDQADKRQAVAAAQAACESGNETRATLREISKETGITSGQTGGEALITALQELGRDVSPEAIETYRQVLDDLLDPALTEIVNRLPGRRWDPDTQTCVDVPVD